MRFTPSSILCIAALLAGCATAPGAPSLAPRAVEKQPVDMPLTTAAEPDSPVDPALQARIATIEASAATVDHAFQEQRTRAAQLVDRAAGSARGGEAWIAAQEAVSALDAERIPLRDAAAQIDALREEPANAAAGNRTAIDAAAARIEGQQGAEADAVAALSGRLD